MIIAGGRDFQDYSLLQRSMDVYLSDVHDEILIISGRAKGADSLGERYADERGYAVKAYPADWHQYGKAAGFIRNEEMAKNADALIAFWNGQSRGTEHMIKMAQKYSLKNIVVIYGGKDQETYIPHLKEEGTDE